MRLLSRTVTFGRGDDDALCDWWGGWAGISDCLFDCVDYGVESFTAVLALDGGFVDLGAAREAGRTEARSILPPEYHDCVGFLTRQSNYLLCSLRKPLIPSHHFRSRGLVGGDKSLASLLASFFCIEKYENDVGTGK